MRDKNKIILISLICLAGFMVAFSFVSAAEADISCDKYQYPWCKEKIKTPADLVQNFYKIALGLAGAAAFGVLIYGAILWTVSGAVSSKQDARERITGALWGLLLLLAAYLILWTINPELVNLKDFVIK
ncbi:hypothetical protein COS61_01390 [Candidatus Wolfebacteria bacterium CG03_land_8_20_14_0_80_40_12]|uniref:Uncharacterized protein n=1 Tax=Candidatus Wolfebacteria bacterium CG03_land_8_20_14_0_80_40_12 TaxID=1975069 RepID=A0A2M7B5Q7_9BACT|nr:MAG: hypothetical protein COS61_01390 [Candidatus Wolfebacteria bacterium CG03_land_8_20_14_0_80_40_12]